MTADPKVTVYMPVYNAEPYLRESIGSILDQTFQDFELIIVDDGSTDRSVEVIDSFQDPRIRLLRQENKGCYPARNAALRLARGEYLANMDADDISLPERLEKQVEFLDQHPTVVLVGTKTYECDMEDTMRLPRPDPIHSLTEEIVPFEMTQSSAPFALPTILFRKELLTTIGFYDERFFFASDLDFVARAATVNDVAYVPQFCYVLRCLPTSISSTGAAIQNEILKILADLSDRFNRNLGRELSLEHIERLKDLEEQRKALPKGNPRLRTFNYENRLATLLRVNGEYRKAVGRLLRAFQASPTSALSNRKFVSNTIRSIAGLILPPPVTSFKVK